MGIPSGPFYIDDPLTWTVDTHTVTTGAVTDADSVPTYRLYEDETGTPILTGSMAKLDDAGTTGFYSEQITLSAANGFEVGKCYSIRTTTAVNSVIAANSYNFKVVATPAAILTAADIRAALGMASANLDTQLTAIDDFLDTEVAAIKAKTDNLPTDPADASDIAASFTTVNTKLDTIDDFLDTEVAAILAAVDTEVGAIKTKTDFLPSVTAGAAGGLFIAGTNAATVITGSLTTTFTGNLTGSVASVTGAVGSVTGNVGGNVTGSVGTVNALAANSITAAATAADFTTEVTAGLATSAALTIIDDFLDTEVAAIKVVTDKLDTALVLDGAVYQFTANALELAPTGGAAPSAATIADAVWDEATSGHVTAGSFGKLVADTNTFVDTEVAAILAAVDTEVAAIKTKTDFLPSATAGSAGGVFIAGTNAATAITGSLTTTFTGNLTGSVGSVTGAVGSVTGAVGSVATDGITSASLATSAITEIQTGLATSAALTVVDDFLDTEITAIKAVTDKLDTALVLDGAVYQYTANALELAPSGGGGGSAADVWNELTAGHVTAGTFGKLVADINAKTTNLPTDPADASDIADAFGAIELAVDNIDDIADAVWASATRTLTAIDENDTTMDIDEAVRTSVGMAFPNLDTQLAAIPASILDLPNGIETGLTMRQTLRLSASALFGEASGLDTTTAIYRDFGDTKTRITATVDDDGNRTAVTLDAS